MGLRRRLLARVFGGGASGATHTGNSMTDRLDAIYARLELESNQLVESEIRQFEKSWRLTET
jgi:hypothetical protein